MLRINVGLAPDSTWEFKCNQLHISWNYDQHFSRQIMYACSSCILNQASPAGSPETWTNIIPIHGAALHSRPTHTCSFRLQQPASPLTHITPLVLNSLSLILYKHLDSISSASSFNNRSREAIVLASQGKCIIHTHTHTQLHQSPSRSKTPLLSYTSSTIPSGNH